MKLSAMVHWAVVVDAVVDQAPGRSRVIQVGMGRAHHISPVYVWIVVVKTMLVLEGERGKHYHISHIRTFSLFFMPSGEWCSCDGRLNVGLFRIVPWTDEVGAC